MTPKALLVLALCVACRPAAAQGGQSHRIEQFAALPNWSGIWEGEVAHELRSEGFDKIMQDALAHPQTIPTVAPPGVLDPVETFVISRTQLQQRPPYNPEWQRRYEQTEHAIQSTPASAVDAGSIMACDWDFPEIMDNPFDTIFQIFITPEETLMLFASGAARHLYTDRAHPKPDDLWPTALGNSVGHWDKDTLVVDTIERRAGPFIRIPHILSPDLSEQARYIERIHLVDPDTLEDDMRIEDAQRLAHPWTLTLRFHRVKDLDRLIPTDCTENNRFRVIDHRVSIVPR